MPRASELDASEAAPQELATGTWLEYGINAKEGTKELDASHYRHEMKARESVAQEMEVSEAAAHQLEAWRTDLPDLEAG